MNKTPENRAKELLLKMTVEEKLHQLTSAMIFDIDDCYEMKRDPLCGSYRNPGHFMHHGKNKPASAFEVCKRINKDIKSSIDAQPNKIPPLENGEALHGAQWGMGTSFPQPIAMASSFDTELVKKIGIAIGKECNAVGVRQVFSPVVNIVRDARWGRTVETFGEDVKLSSDMGGAMTYGLEKSGVIATPKHFADNYGAGGRDSNYSETSERTMRETILPPFESCIRAGAQSVMAAYNAWEGIPCSANEKLLTDILRNEWGFRGFVVSDYSGVEGMVNGHKYCRNFSEAIGKALESGLDIVLPNNMYENVLKAYKNGNIKDEILDRSVLRILTAKYKSGLFDNPYRDANYAMSVVRCKKHKNLALKAAEESIILLKNEQILPLNKSKIKKIGIYGKSANEIPVGKNYSGPYNYPWTGEDAPTPLEAISNYLGKNVLIHYNEDVDDCARENDVNIYFTSIIEGEGADRSDLRLPSISLQKKEKNAGGIIVDNQIQTVKENQENEILKMIDYNPFSIVVLLNGAPVDMTKWIKQCAAIIEAWYPGEQGAKALTKILFGEVNPSAKLPVTFPKNAGQLPLFYSYKPSGRGYAYCDDDGKPEFPFGFGLSYSKFTLSEYSIDCADNKVKLSFSIENKGRYDGTQVVQLYISGSHCDVVRPVKELKAYKRITVNKGRKVKDCLCLEENDFYYYNSQMEFGLFDGDYKLLLGFSSEDIIASFKIKVKNNKIKAMK